uniref:Toll-like receptor 9 n=1 Tax=Callorhinchus milii TaxID=7868 RepID=A0A4W3JL51_CALMI|eukprot:gi/632946297/ref/XP_007888489.1/ PREDICTED: toll-like receptor 7 [Callorhinchus milii]
MCSAGTWRNCCQICLVLINSCLVMGIFPIYLPCDGNVSSANVDCSKRDLTSVPKIKSANITNLFLNNNHLELIELDAFSGLPSLENLDLSMNCLPGKMRPPGLDCQVTIQPGAFVRLHHLTSLNLAGNSLTIIPGLPTSLQILNFELNNVAKLQFDNVSNIANLLHFYIGKNCFYKNPCNVSFTIEGDTFQNMIKLQTLDLKFNNITTVPKALPRDLKMLDLSENKIPSISAEDFRNLTQLEYLLLAWNCQRCDHAAQPCFPCKDNKSIELSHDAFLHQHQLRTLVLRGNSLNHIEDKIFESLENLTVLDLSDNFLANEIQNATFYQALPKLQVLNVMYNYQPNKTFPTLSLPPSFRNLRSLTTFLIDGFFFKNMNKTDLSPLLSLPNLQVVNFRMNFIQHISMKLFANNTSLRYIGMSQNKISFSQRYCCPNGPGDKSFSIASTASDRQHIIERSSEEPQFSKSHQHFCDPKSDKVFDLSSNNIADIQQEDFVGLEHIECLLLSCNYMTQSLNGKQFTHLKNLKRLDLSHNRIDFYYKEAFTEIPKLEVLDLSYNSYTFQMKGMGHRFMFINNLKNLRVLNLAHNRIGQRVTKELYSKSLNTLHFNGNSLNIMWKSGENTYLNFFSNLYNLTMLDISNNKLLTVPREAMLQLPKSLRQLYIKNNKINFFPWDSLSNLTALEMLDLSSNYLKQLPKRAYYFPQTFHQLILRKNKIRKLNSDFFSKVVGLTHLDLSHNFIKLLDADSFPPQLLRRLSILNLSQNPFRCTCDSDWFIRFIRDTKVTLAYLTTDWKCGFPESEQGKSILLTDPLSCQKIYGSVGFILSFLVTVVFTLLPILQKLFGWDFWYTFHVIAAKVQGSKTTPSGTLQYDAFIVFDTAHEAVADWVYHELVVNLEKRGPLSSKLCLEERDWIPGKTSIENLYDAIYKSRKTVFILTNGHFVSGMLRQAFFIAHQRLLDEKTDVIVLVLLDGSLKESKYLQLRKKLCRASVLKWPKNPHAEHYFWYKLQRILARDNRLQYDQNFSGGFLPYESLQYTSWQ